MPTTQTTTNYHGSSTLLVKANGGQVTVEKQVNGAWVIVDTFKEDGGWVYAFGNSPTRITPTGGAVYEVTA